MEPKKICFDCLHCKISKKSSEQNRLCFCAKTKAKENHRDGYWLARSVCKKFEAMDDPTFTEAVIPKKVLSKKTLSKELPRCRLLRGSVYERF